MRIEFLQTEDDVCAFVDFLYSNDVILSRKRIILTKEDAMNSLSVDLHLAGGVYRMYHDGELLLTMNSCSRDAHPRKLGKPGRVAGLIADISDSQDAKELIREINKYFKKTYTRKRYNGEARMVCYFGPYYSQLDEMYQSNPEEENVCPGLIRILCMDEQVTSVMSIAENVLAQIEPIDVTRITKRKYWEEHTVVELRIELRYDIDRFSFSDCRQLTLDLAGQHERLNCSETHIHNGYMWAENDCSIQQVLTSGDRRKVLVYMARSWVRFRKEFLSRKNNGID